MKLGLHISDFTWPAGPARLGPDLANVARTADDVGFDRVSVMDHVWQIGVIGPPEHEMLEAYTTLGYLVAHTSRVKLLTLVTGVTYRSPGLLAKIVTTLDVLSGGRGMLGIGAAWNEEESRGLGLFFPPLAERYERLEETLRICQQMWSDDDGPTNVPSRGLAVRVGRHEIEDDEADAGYARRCERADSLGYAYGLTASAMGGHGGSWAYARDARGTRPVPGCLRPIRQPSFPRPAWSTSHPLAKSRPCRAAAPHSPAFGVCEGSCATPADHWITHGGRVAARGSGFGIR